MTLSVSQGVRTPTQNSAVSTSVSMQPVGGPRDPQQRVTFADNTITIRGIASNNGVIRSTIAFDLDGQRVSVGLNRGDTPDQTAAKIAAALPAGYTATVGQVAYRPGPGQVRPVVVTIETAE